MGTDEMRKTKETVHVARVIADRLEGFEPMKGSMTDEIVTGSVKRNPDGSLTINCQISVTDHATGERWCVGSRMVRLPLERRKRV